ncbi:Stp1/IreP family PP2C-type Ser/Thr phosphatase [Faecalicoccus acidiformans]|uniref:Stp1/IreP family PP2C-type Ser/Thr phosphatase n=1 Tax=Faecalicoccus acidiformans TaxID=915173 RepID=A0ABS2FQG1_9FIRM|nr:Stp1/IreP family PP2C-type Ser/Thr phosphatase [Faecalicoccus acidiformans]MBM6831546.1 Stp1/IreP family PP2C-type Ser/Thr phosphatase [Faecalicoccus acidiformans]HIW17516.1 Stp1/IreP family PP2C-type Ser/Thr phosphatase [Candidatus Faecalicoccus intestinipullorum]
MKIYANTDVGLTRKINEDDFLVLQNENDDLLAMVCDGIGGAAAGEVASAIAVNTFRSAFLNVESFENDGQALSWIRETMDKANDRIYQQSMLSRRERGMGTTCVGVLITHQHSYIFNVGDSRLYAQYSDGLIQMTEDHSVIAQLIKEGKITAEEAKHHAQKNTLTNALGVWHVYRVDTNKIDEDYKRLLICSDGLHGYVEYEKICEVLSQKSTLEQKGDRLLSLSLQAGGYDNCTIILLEKEGM